MRHQHLLIPLAVGAACILQPASNAWSQIPNLLDPQNWIDPLGLIDSGRDELEKLSPGTLGFISFGNPIVETILKGGSTDIAEINGGVFISIVNPSAGAIRTFTKAGGDVVTAVEDTKKQVTASFIKANGDLAATYTKAWRDVIDQAGSSFEDAVDAGNAMLRYQQRVTRDSINGLGAAERRVREGKVVDAAWGLATEPLQSQERNFYLATQESSLVNQAAASAAAIYGGPGGAAAYAAWSTYRSTGDANQAFRAGVVAGLASQVGAGEAPLPASAPMTVAIKKAAIAGSAGGLAVASQGGDEAAIRDGFLRSAGAVLVQVGKDKLSAYAPDAASTLQLAECISARDVDCVSKTTYVKDAQGRLIKSPNGLPRIAPKAIDPKVDIGKWTGIDINSPAYRNLKLITDISKVPDSQLISIGNNSWVLSTTLGQSQAVEYGKPVVVLTAVGANAPYKFVATFGPHSGSVAGNYDCSFPNDRRTIRTTRFGTSCETIHRRQDGSMQVIWRTPTHADACPVKAHEFSQRLARLGASCQKR